ncbi:hypothetical protein COB21_01790 [Candidatus Aerophobetes bacterium]|uniref:Uncharacterized protein n=1 Tax=Aerophobetes bacterium TaxID=2030807 RepID=A0A2A4X653_UNCAE|nr:MAG: hypothetical protein COB21_01790 [Candidatus Aerophobetes bacterium]
MVQGTSPYTQHRHGDIFAKNAVQVFEACVEKSSAICVKTGQVARAARDVIMRHRDGARVEVEFSARDVKFIPVVGSVADLMEAYAAHKAGENLSAGARYDYGLRYYVSRRVASAAVKLCVLWIIYNNTGKLLKTLVVDAAILMPIGYVSGLKGGVVAQESTLPEKYRPDDEKGKVRSSRLRFVLDPKQDDGFVVDWTNPRFTLPLKREASVSCRASENSYFDSDVDAHALPGLKRSHLVGVDMELLNEVYSGDVPGSLTVSANHTRAAEQLFGDSSNKRMTLDSFHSLTKSAGIYGEMERVIGKVASEHVEGYEPDKPVHLPKLLQRLNQGENVAAEAVIDAVDKWARFAETAIQGLSKISPELDGDKIVQGLHEVKKELYEVARQVPESVIYLASAVGQALVNNAAQSSQKRLQDGKSEWTANDILGAKHKLLALAEGAIERITEQGQVQLTVQDAQRITDTVTHYSGVLTAAQTLVSGVNPRALIENGLSQATGGLQSLTGPVDQAAAQTPPDLSALHPAVARFVTHVTDVLAGNVNTEEDQEAKIELVEMDEEGNEGVELEQDPIAPIHSTKAQVSALLGAGRNLVQQGEEVVVAGAVNARDQVVENLQSVGQRVVAQLGLLDKALTGVDSKSQTAGAPKASGGGGDPDVTVEDLSQEEINALDPQVATGLFAAAVASVPEAQRAGVVELVQKVTGVIGTVATAAAEDSQGLVDQAVNSVPRHVVQQVLQDAFNVQAAATNTLGAIKGVVDNSPDEVWDTGFAMLGAGKEFLLENMGMAQALLGGITPADVTALANSNLPADQLVLARAGAEKFIKTLERIPDAFVKNLIESFKSMLPKARGGARRTTGSRETEEAEPNKPMEEFTSNSIDLERVQTRLLSLYLEKKDVRFLNLIEIIQKTFLSRKVSQRIRIEENSRGDDGVSEVFFANKPVFWTPSDVSAHVGQFNPGSTGSRARLVLEQSLSQFLNGVRLPERGGSDEAR